MKLAQDVVARPAKTAIFLTVTVGAGQEAAARAARADVPGLTGAVGFRIPGRDSRGTEREEL